MAGRVGGSVFLLTDYGLADEFAGVVRASVARHAPGVPIIDLTHGVTPFDIRAGALSLVRAVPHLGPGVVLAVVDPGVGTKRRAIAVSVTAPTTSNGPQHFVGPDNGLLPWALDTVGGSARAVAITAPHTQPPAQDNGVTFDGRDLFAPVAARLWQGVPVTELGDEIDTAGLVRLPPPQVSVSAGVLEAEVLWVDRFGNVQLAAGPDDASAAGLGAELDVIGSGGAVGSSEEVVHRARMVRAFGALGPGAIGLLVDANGRLALVCDRQSAATVLQVHPCDTVTLRAVATDRASS